MKDYISSLIQAYPKIYLFVSLFKPGLKGIKESLQEIHAKFSFSNNENTLAVDLGCGPKPMNLFGAENIIGIDMRPSSENIIKCHLGFEKLPLEDNSVDYLTSYDLLEHIPRYSDKNIETTPFIFLMNECYRVLKSGGLFLSKTPIYPYPAAFQDPTHNNILTEKTFEYYFSNKKFDIASHYGITANFHIKFQGIQGQHLLAILEKK